MRSNGDHRIPRGMQSTITQITHLSSIAKLLSFPARLGIGGQGLRRWTERVGNLQRQTDELTRELAQFQNTFADRGWLLTSRTSSEVARRAIETDARSGARDADEILAHSFTGQNLDHTMMYLTSIRAFQLRRSQLDEAVALTNEGRYMSAVPLLLIIADGVGSDIFNRSIFAQDTDLEDLDSFAGQPDALPKLIKEICSARRKTRSDDISFPYRNGILHGRDLGYGNIIVTSKCWSLLVSIADIHRSREGRSVWGETEIPMPTSVGQALRTLRDSIHDFGAIQERRRRINDWKRRPVMDDRIEVFSDRRIPFDPVQPEYSLTRFLSAWKNRNYGKMSELTISFGESSTNKRAGEIRAAMEEVELSSATVTRIADRAAALTIVSAVLLVFFDGNEYEKSIDFRLFCQDASGDPAIRDDQDIRWLVNTDYLSMRDCLR